MYKNVKDIGITIFDVGGIYEYLFKKILNIAQNESISNQINT